MKTRFKFLTCGLLVLSISIISCEKDGTEGPMGPIGSMGEQGVAGVAGPAGENGEALGVPGPQGAQGETGAAGLAGEAGETGSAGANGANGVNGTNGSNGTNGADGNANVMVSDWITTAFSQTAAFATGFSVTDPNLTTEVINNSLILGYGKRNSVFKDILPLPIQILNQKYQIELSDLGGENYRLLFRGLSVDGSTEVFNLLAEVRYFVIPVNNTTGKSRSDFEKMSYDEIVTHFQLDY